MLSNSRAPVTPQFEKRCAEASRLQRSLLQCAGAGRCFGVAYAAQGSIDVLSLLGVVRRKGWPAARQQMWRALSPRGRAFRVGGLVGLFNLTFAAARSLLLAAVPQAPRMGTAAAGAVAGLVLALDDNPNRRTTLALYSLVRAFHFAALTMARRNCDQASARGRGRAMWSWVMEHGDVAIFVISNFEIMFSWFYHPERLPPAYEFWISKMAELDPRIRGVLRAKYEGAVNYGERTDFLAAYCREHNLDPRCADFVACKPIPRIVVHPTDASSTMNVLRRFGRGFLNSATMYLPVYAVPSLLMRPSEVARDPGAWLSRLARKTGLSSMFLATYISNVFAWIYATRLALRDDTTLGPLLGCGTCGLSILFEKKERRSELALYVFPRALHSWWMQSQERGWVTPVRHGEVLVFSCAMAAIMFHLEHERSSTKSLQWLLSLIISTRTYQ